LKIKNTLLTSFKVLCGVVFGFLLVSLFWVLLYKWVDPTVTPLMILSEKPVRKEWIDLEHISPFLIKSVIVAEDSNFCRHHGFDWKALEKAWSHYRGGKRLLGGSTITMQTAKNIFLWPDRTFIRKALEAWFTILIETFWRKNRIIEIYLNNIEWGKELYGIEAASKIYFKRSASSLSKKEASLLAAVIPNPKRYNALKPSRYVSRRSQRIRKDVRIVRWPKTKNAYCVLEE